MNRVLEVTGSFDPPEVGAPESACGLGVESWGTPGHPQGAGLMERSPGVCQVSQGRRNTHF